MLYDHTCSVYISPYLTSRHGSPRCLHFLFCRHVGDHEVQHILLAAATSAEFLDNVLEGESYAALTFLSTLFTRPGRLWFCCCLVPGTPCPIPSPPPNPPPSLLPLPLPSPPPSPPIPLPISSPWVLLGSPGLLPRM